MIPRIEACLLLFSFYVVTVVVTVSRPVALGVLEPNANHVSPVWPEVPRLKPHDPTHLDLLRAAAKAQFSLTRLDEVSIHNDKKKKKKASKGKKKGKGKKNDSKKKGKGKKNDSKKKNRQAKKKRAQNQKNKNNRRRHRPRPRTRSKSLKFKPWTGCKTERRSCGKSCGQKQKSKCKVTVSSPRLCMLQVKEKYACAGQRVAMCQGEEKEAAICTKLESKTMPCDMKLPDPKKVCKRRTVSVKCVPKICATYDRIPCKYKTVLQPCDRPSKKCNDCVGRYKLRQCSKTYNREVEVECPPELLRNVTTAETAQSSPAASPSVPVSPTPSATPRPFEDSNVYASNARCLASLFDEEECRYADRKCQLFSDWFDSTVCAVQVCEDCRQLRYMSVTPGLKRYCFELLQSSCRTLYSIHQVAIYRIQVPAEPESLSVTARTSNIKFNPVDGKCYKPESKTVSAPCNVPLPPNKSCINRCIVGTCERRIAKGRCRGNLPDKCKKPRKCKKTETACSYVTEDLGMCEYKVPVEYVCYKKKKVSHPCFFSSRLSVLGNNILPTNLLQPPKKSADLVNNMPKLCTRFVSKKHLCGSMKKTLWAQCQQKGCRKKNCIKEICRK